jgi:hypothetical protein
MVGDRSGDGAMGEGPSGLVWSPWSGTYNFDSCTNATVEYEERELWQHAEILYDWDDPGPPLHQGDTDTHPLQCDWRGVERLVRYLRVQRLRRVMGA